ncbi:MAG: sigma-70 family RNA polymerase sigma factor [Myxococcales bacterium]|nr:sigma-70 family RNA polymerase sigma factor [Myxococcales bacterium]
MISAPVSPTASETPWRELETRLRPFVARRVSRAADVDDVLQDVFLRLQRGLGGLRDADRFGPWVYQVTRSAIIDHGRSQARHPLATHQRVEPDPLPSDENAAEPLLASSITLFVNALPEPYREALTLTELGGLTQREAAERLGISLSGMKSRVQRGRALVKQALLDCCHIALDGRGRVMGCEVRPDGKLPAACCGASGGCGDGPVVEQPI